MSDTTAIPVEQKVWYKNATVWVNIITVGCLIATQYCGIQIDPKLQAGLIAIVNLVLQAPTMATTQAKAEEHNRAIRSKMIS